MKARTKRLAKQYFSKLRGEARREDGVLGDGNGKVHAGLANHCYVRVRGVPMVVYNDRTSLIDNLPVIVGYDDLEPDFLQVLGAKHRAGVNYPTNYSTSNHHQQHEFLNAQGGDDVVWVHERQLLPLRVSPDGLGITVKAGVIRTTSGFIEIKIDQARDLAGHRPEEGARWVLVSLERDGDLILTDGEVVWSKDVLYVSQLPVVPSGNVALAAIKLYAGQERIVEAISGSDVLDLRLALGGADGDMQKATYDTNENGIVDAAESVPWEGVSGKPTAYPPETHAHDERYYTETELQTAGSAAVHWGNVSSKPVSYPAENEARLQAVSGPVAVSTLGYNPGQVLVPQSWALGQAGYPRDDFFQDNFGTNGAQIWTAVSGCEAMAYQINAKPSYLELQSKPYTVSGASHAVWKADVSAGTSYRWQFRLMPVYGRTQSHRIGIAIFKPDLRMGVALWYKYIYNSASSQTWQIELATYNHASEAWLSHPTAKTTSVAYTTNWTTPSPNPVWNGAVQPIESLRPVMGEFYLRQSPKLLYFNLFDVFGTNSNTIVNEKSWDMGAMPYTLFLFVEGNLQYTKGGMFDFIYHV